MNAGSNVDHEPSYVAERPRLESQVDLSVVMPVYNEEEALANTLEEAVAALSDAAFCYEIVIVDDASTDDSGQILEQWRRRYPEIIRVVRHESNRGIAAACQTLFREARGVYVFLNASDGQWKTAECLRMMEIRDRYDLVIGVRKQKHYTLWRKAVSGAFNLLPRLCFGVPTYDAGSIKLYKAEVLTIPLISRGVFGEAERIIRAERRGYRVGTIEVDHFSRTGGLATGARLSVVAVAVADLLRCWWRITVCRDW
jgi:glycosyltransferase involved in cell wall biosynthesis